MGLGRGFGGFLEEGAGGFGVWGLVFQPSKMFIEEEGGAGGGWRLRVSRGGMEKSWKELSEEKIEIFSCELWESREFCISVFVGFF